MVGISSQPTNGASGLIDSTSGLNHRTPESTDDNTVLDVVTPGSDDGFSRRGDGTSALHDGGNHESTPVATTIKVGGNYFHAMEIMGEAKVQNGHRYITNHIHNYNTPSSLQAAVQILCGLAGGITAVALTALQKTSSRHRAHQLVKVIENPASANSKPVRHQVHNPAIWRGKVLHARLWELDNAKLEEIWLKAQRSSQVAEARKAAQRSNQVAKARKDARTPNQVAEPRGIAQLCRSTLNERNHRTIDDEKSDSATAPGISGSQIRTSDSRRYLTTLLMKLTQFGVTEYASIATFCAHNPSIFNEDLRRLQAAASAYMLASDDEAAQRAAHRCILLHICSTKDDKVAYLEALCDSAKEQGGISQLLAQYLKELSARVPAGNEENDDGVAKLRSAAPDKPRRQARPNTDTSDDKPRLRASLRRRATTSREEHADYECPRTVPSDEPEDPDLADEARLTNDFLGVGTQYQGRSGGAAKSIDVGEEGPPRDGDSYTHGPSRSKRSPGNDTTKPKDPGSGSSAAPRGKSGRESKLAELTSETRAIRSVPRTVPAV